MKKNFSDFLQKLGTFFLLNIAVIFVYLVIYIIFKIPVVNELADRFADADALNGVLYAIYAISYYVILALLVFKNPSARRAFLNATSESGYSFKREALVYIKDFFVSDIIALALISVISYALLGVFVESAVLRLIFLPQYSISELFGASGASVIYPVFTFVWNFAVTVSAQYIWDRNRLGEIKKD